MTKTTALQTMIVIAAAAALAASACNSAPAPAPAPSATGPGILDQIRAREAARLADAGPGHDAGPSPTK